MTGDIDCRIVWDGMDRETWEEGFAAVERANLLQSYGYARAVCPREGQRPRHGRILIDGTVAGLVQIQEAQVFNRAIHAIILDRGPLWLPGFGTPANIGAFFSAFDREFPRRLGRRRRILPEVTDTPEMRETLAATRLRKREGAEGYQTVWVDLRPETEVLRQKLKGRWRSSLVRAEASELTVEWHWDGATLLKLLGAYEEDKTRRGYPGPSVGTVADLCRALLPEERVLIGNALLDGDIVASVLILGHGAGATYQIGWTSEAGRSRNATHLLLWGAMLALKEKGYRDLDLGGVNDGDAKGVKLFKEGMGGTTVTLIGHYE